MKYIYTQIKQVKGAAIEVLATNLFVIIENRQLLSVVPLSTCDYTNMQHSNHCLL